MMELMDAALDAPEELPAVPLPETVDTLAVVFASLLGGGTRPLVLDASAVREVHPAAAPLLVSLLRSKREAGVPAQIEGASEALRRGLAGHALAAYLAGPADGDEVLFVCPDRDRLGFSQSRR